MVNLGILDVVSGAKKTSRSHGNRKSHGSKAKVRSDASCALSLSLSACPSVSFSLCIDIC
jgi:hypothetical protein